MTTALAVAQPQQGGLSREQLELLKRTIARGTTDDEFALFVSTAQRLQLDPFTRHIFCVKRWDSREGREVMSIQVSIDGFRTTAARTGELDGQEGPFWCGDDGVWRDVWLHKEAPAAAKVIVYRKGCSHGFTGIATYDSYVQTKKSGEANSTWARLPDVMLAKCAESLALRKAFPAELSGVYTTDEMGQADNDNSPREVPHTVTIPPKPDPIEALSIEALIERVQLTKATPDLKKLAPECNALPKGSPERVRVMDAYKAHEALLKQEGV